ncbi:hypothetical protein [Micromonospora sp. NPDC050200]|uniref:hypothetical protein n=1 Tax=Micromonospora sp. NPDC050200 TaxID=3155664 RepID=UPI0033F9307F
MTTDPIEPVVPDIDESYADDLDDGPYVEENSGQVARRVGRDMVQNVHNWLGRYQAARELSDTFVQETIETFVGRVYGRAGCPGKRRPGSCGSGVTSCWWPTPAPAGAPPRSNCGGVPSPRREIPIDDDEQRLLPVDEVPWSSYGRCAYLVSVPPGGRNGRLRELLIAYREAVEKRDSYLVVLVDQKSLERPEDVPGFTVLTVTAPTSPVGTATTGKPSSTPGWKRRPTRTRSSGQASDRSGRRTWWRTASTPGLRGQSAPW